MTFVQVLCHSVAGIHHILEVSRRYSVSLGFAYKRQTMTVNEKIPLVFSNTYLPR